MALTQAQRDSIKAALNLDTLDTYASNPDSLIEQMTPEQLLEGLKCGTLSLEQLNYLFFLGFTATEKAFAESKAYTDANKADGTETKVVGTSPIKVSGDGSQTSPYNVVYDPEIEESLSNLFVDKVNGDDENVGTKESPLKTPNAAEQKIPDNSVGATIWLYEDQDHVIETFSANKSFRIAAYGTLTDGTPTSIKTRWNPELTGWTHFSAKEFKEIAPRLLVDPQMQLANDGMNYSATLCSISKAHSIEILGCKIGMKDTGKQITSIFPWQGIFFGEGSVKFNECTILNENWAGNVHLCNGHDGNINVTAVALSAESADPVDYLWGVYSGIKVTIEAGRDEFPHPSGLTWSTTLSDITVKSLVSGAALPVMVSPNYDTNV